MNVFKFITPSGQSIEVTGPAGSTYDQALAVFNQQLNTGSLVGLKSGDVLNSLIQARGGLAAALAQVTSALNSGSIGQIASVLTKIPNLPPPNPTTVSTFVNTPVLAGNDVGTLTNIQVQGLLSSTATAVNQAPTDVTVAKGLGTYGLTPDQLQQAGLIKPGTADLINQDPANTVSILSSPTVWTGRDGADSLESVLANPTLQSAAQQSTLSSSYDQLQQLGVVNQSTTADPYAGLTAEQIDALGNADATDPYIRSRLGLPPLVNSTSSVGSIVNNAANFGVGPTLDWLKNTAGGSTIGQLTNSALNSIFGMNFSQANQSISGGVNPLQTGVQTPKGYSNTANRSVIDTAFNSIIGNNKVPKNIFENPGLGIDIRNQPQQLSAINQSASILLTKLASTTAGVAALSQVPGANSIMSLLKSGQGLVSEIKGAAQLLDQAKNLPGVGELLKDVPGSAEILSELKNYGTELSAIGQNLFENVKDLFSGSDISAFTDFDAAGLLEGADQVIEEAAPVAEAAVEYIASFW